LRICSRAGILAHVGKVGAPRLAAAVEAKGRGHGAERFDAKGDVLVERDAQFLRAFVNIFAADTAGERFVLQFFLHRSGFHFMDAFRRLDERAGGQETGELVAGEKSLIELRDAGYPGLIRVTENGGDDLFGIAALAKD